MATSTSSSSTQGDLYEDTGPRQISTTTILLVLATLFVILRFWARYLVVAKYGLDDWLIVAGLGATFTIGGLNYGMVSHGLGRHAALIPMSEQVNFFKLLLAFECLYVTAVALVKLSILAMYLRIFPSRGFKIAAWIIGGLVIAWAVAIILVCIFQCSPIYVAWMPWEAGTCIDLKASFIGNAVPNIMTDVAILTMPIKQVWKLHATWAQKVSLLCTFMLGSFVLIASIYRFSTIMAFDILDTTFTLATACTWCVVEVACGVICACLPTLRPLARKVSSQFGSSGHSKPSRQPSRGPTELVTIGGSNMHSRSHTKSPFRRLSSGKDLSMAGIENDTTTTTATLTQFGDEERDVAPGGGGGGGGGVRKGAANAVRVTTQITQTRTVSPGVEYASSGESMAVDGKVTTSSWGKGQGQQDFV